MPMPMLSACRRSVAGAAAAERLEAHKATFEPLTRWLGDKLGAWITRAAVSRRLARSPAALAATAFGWTGNMERLAMSNAHQKVQPRAAGAPGSPPVPHAEPLTLSLSPAGG